MALRLAARDVSFKKLWKKARENPTEFSVWTNLLDLVEKEQNIDHARKAFESFFEYFPYCYGYWKKYADMERHQGNKELSLQVYASGVKSVPLSVDLWVAYLDAATEVYHTHDDYEIKMRSLYEEAISEAGLEFRSDALWEHYISWETERNHLVNVLNIYTRLLATPTQSYFQNWDSLNKLIEENPPEELLSHNEFARLHAQVSLTAAKTLSDDMEPPIVGVTKPVVEITDSVRMAIRQLVVESRERVYQATYSQIMKRWYFEEKIRRPYFHVKPLEEVQLTNWAEYLSFEEAEASAVRAACRDEIRSRGLADGDDETVEAALAASEQVAASRKRVHILYERCLVACALYEHFWIRYARYLEVVEGDIAAARAIWRRACTVHLRYKPTIHWHWACFEERFPASLDDPKVYQVLSGLDILTELEKRLTDSPLVCCRRADALRRAGRPLFDIVACLRGGINRLRFLAKEQDKVAQAVSGATASRTVAQAIATASQARAAAGVLAGRLSRLLHRDESLTSGGVPLWMLLLDTTCNEEAVIQEEAGLEDEEPEQDSAEVKVEENEVEEGATGGVEKKIKDGVDARTPVDGRGDGEEEDSSLEENGANSPPMLVVPCDQRDEVKPDAKQSRKRNSDVQERRQKKRSRRSRADDGMEDDQDMKEEEEGDSEAQSEEELLDGDDDSDDMEEEEEQPEANIPTVEEQEKAAREAQAAAEEEEEERLRAMLDKRQPLVPIPRPAVDALTEAECQVLTPEEAAIRVLKEAIEYDPRNERLYAQLVDIAYQRRPVDIEGFIEMCNLATIDSMLPASIKLAFCQRKLQFLEEFDTNILRLTLAYNEYLRLCEAVNNGVVTTTAISSYPLPDLLNLPSASVRIASVAAANAASDDLPSLASASPVARQLLLKTDQTALEAAASVGTPAPDPSTSAGFYTAGGYEPLAAALGNTGSLPPPVPTNIPVLGDPIAGNGTAAATWVDPYTGSYYYGAAAVSGVPLVNYAAAGTTTTASTEACVVGPATTTSSAVSSVAPAASVGVAGAVAAAVSLH